MSPGASECSCSKRRTEGLSAVDAAASERTAADCGALCAGKSSPASCKRAGTSTVTLSVSSSTSGSSLTTVSPTALSHFRMVARVPSSFGGTSTSSMRLMSDFDLRDDRLRNGVDAGQHRVEQQGVVRAGDVRHRETLDRSVEIEKGFLGQHGGNFR